MVHSTDNTGGIMVGSDDIGMDVQGFKELDALLGKLPDQIADKVLQRVANKAMREALPNVKAAAPKHTGKQSEASQKFGTIESNLKVNKYRKTKQGQKGARVTTGKSFWAVWYEFGSRHQPARPWLLPAMQRETANIFSTVKKELGKGITREFKKLNKGKK